MPEYGYKISEMAGAERFFEAERLLDIKLKGFEKGNAEFDEDGSRRQEYIKSADDGSRERVTLIKNVTECGTLVFSDIPLKFFRFGGKVFYLWDILPTALTGIFWWGIFPELMNRSRLGFLQLAAVQAAAGAAVFFAGMLAGKILEKTESRERRYLRILFVPYRTKLRTQFLLRGGAVTAIAFIISFFKIFSGLNGYELLKMFLQSPIPVLIVSTVPLFMKRRER